MVDVHSVDIVHRVDITGPIYARFPCIDAADADGWCWRAEVKGGGHAGGRHCRSRRIQNGDRDAERGRGKS